MTPEALMNCWKSGQRISNSLSSFAMNQKERDAINASEEGLFMSVAAGFAETYAYANDHGVPLAEAAAIIQAKQKEQRENKEIVIERLKNELKQGRIAFAGFEPPRKVADVPVIIPTYYLNGKIDWLKGTLTSGALNFVELRIIKLPTETISASAPPNLKRVGRRSRRELYLECFAALHSMGKLNSEHSQNSHFAHARKWLATNHPDVFQNEDVGSDKTMYKYFNEFRSILNQK